MSESSDNLPAADDRQGTPSLTIADIRTYNSALDARTDGSLSEELRSASKVAHEKIFALTDDQFGEFVRSLPDDSQLQEVKSLLKRLPKKEEEVN